jgi:hypothetical protein
LPSSPLAQVARLTQAGVDQSIILTYVTNSSSTFNLDSDKIIYLSDLGAPSNLITAMMLRDQQLQAQFAASQAAQQASQIQPAPAAPPAAAAPTATTDVAAQPDTQPAPVTVDSFNDALSPYGSWIVVNGYGRCWRPTVVAYDPTWQPYCDRGRWVYTDCGWYWNSDYAWGATFHYGRWFRDASVGWCWYPDTVWAPSWVTWRYSNSYCGWAPLPPRTSYRAGVGIVYNGGGVSVGFGFGLGASCFTFVPTQRFCDPHPRNYCIGPAQVTQVYNNTTIINNYNVNNRTIANRGIAVQNIAGAAHTTIRPVPLHELNNNPRVYGRPAYAPGANRTAFTGNYGSQSYAATQNHFPQTQPAHIYNATPVPQRPAPAVNYYSPTHVAPSQVPAANRNQQPAPTQWQQQGTPRSAAQNYYQPRQNYYHPGPIAPPQPHAAPNYAPAQSGGSHNGNQNGSPH